MTTGASAGFESLVEELLHSCPMIRSIWLIGLPPEESANVPEGTAPELIAFADDFALRSLRMAVPIHRRRVKVLVVTDGDAFSSAWGDDAPGSLSRLEWRQTTAGMAYYNVPSLPAGVTPLRKRRRAVRIWHGAG